MQYPFLYQYKVRPASLLEQRGFLAGAIATVIVFAESEPDGRCRSGRFLLEKGWNIIEIMRVLVICPYQVHHFDDALRKIYGQAELFGIAACFDGWKELPHV